MSEALVWIDCEMTGLNPAVDVLVEVAVVITDSELTILDDGLDLLIKTDPDKLASMEEVVREMHATSGLTEALTGATLTVEEAETQLLDYLKKQDRVVPLSEMSDHFAFSQLRPWHLESACEWLERKGLLEKVSAPFKLTKRSLRRVEEPAYFLNV